MSQAPNLPRLLDLFRPESASIAENIVTYPHGEKRESLVHVRIDVTWRRLKLKRMEFQVGTGALNRRRFLELGETELPRAQRSGRSVAVLVMDIDNFKQINDENGHAAGDTVLKTLVERWDLMLRSHDNLGRIGGEEFAVLLSDTDAAAVNIVADRIRAVVESIPVAAGDKIVRATVSVGHAICRIGVESLEDTLSRADAALYAAKNAGRNCCIAAAA